jgi:drug/metabolite transporter (DMT)-like permease
MQQEVRVLKNEKGVIFAYITVCIVWGSTYLAMRVAVGGFPPELFAGMRFLLAGIIVMAYAVAAKKEFPISGKDVIKAAVPGILMLMGSNGLVMWAEQWVHSGITSLLLSVTPLFVALVEVIVLRDTKIGTIGWGCLIMGFLGTVMLVVSGAGIGSVDAKGGFLVLAAALLWSLGSIYSSRVKFTGNIATHIAIQMLAAGTGLTILGLILGEAKKVSLSTNVVLALVYLVIFGSIAGYSCNMYVLSKWPASKAITSAYVNPIVAVILGVVILNEQINPAMILCMIITLGSVVLLHFIKYGMLKGK